MSKRIKRTIISKETAFTWLTKISNKKTLKKYIEMIYENKEVSSFTNSKLKKVFKKKIFERYFTVFQLIRYISPVCKKWKKWTKYAIEKKLANYTILQQKTPDKTKLSLFCAYQSYCEYHNRYETNRRFNWEICSRCKMTSCDIVFKPDALCIYCCGDEICNFCGKRENRRDVKFCSPCNIFLCKEHSHGKEKMCITTHHTNFICGLSTTDICNECYEQTLLPCEFPDCDENVTPPVELCFWNIICKETHNLCKKHHKQCPKRPYTCRICFGGKCSQCSLNICSVKEGCKNLKTPLNKYICFKCVGYPI